MGMPGFNARDGTSVEISQSAAQPELDPEPPSEKIGTDAETGAQTGAETGAGDIPAERVNPDDGGAKPKKSLAFKLAFIGLAASLFVFQLDATALGIALPVSNTTSPSAVAQSKTKTPGRL